VRPGPNRRVPTGRSRQRPTRRLRDVLELLDAHERHTSPDGWPHSSSNNSASHAPRCTSGSAATARKAGLGWRTARRGRRPARPTPHQRLRPRAGAARGDTPRCGLPGGESGCRLLRGARPGRNQRPARHHLTSAMVPRSAKQPRGEPLRRILLHAPSPMSYDPDIQSTFSAAVVAVRRGS
jgi:hypothetical protein